jgi:hypothetical protein
MLEVAGRQREKDHESSPYNPDAARRRARDSPVHLRDEPEATMKPHSTAWFGAHHYLRLIWCVGWIALVWLAPLTVLAQEQQEAKAPRSYVLGYALTTLCIGLGLFIVVRPGKRKFPKIRRKDDEEDLKPKHH